MVMLFPNDEAETRQVPQDLKDVDLIYVNSSGNRLGRGVFNTADLGAWGWKMDYESALVTNVTLQSVERTISALMATGLSREDSAAMVRARKRVEDVIGLDELYAIESRDLGIGGGV